MREDRTVLGSKSLAKAQRYTYIWISAQYWGSKTWDTQAAEGHGRHKAVSLEESLKLSEVWSRASLGRATAVPQSRGTHFETEMIKMVPAHCHTTCLACPLCPCVDKPIAICLQLFIGFPDGQELSFAKILLCARHGVTTILRKLRPTGTM